MRITEFVSFCTQRLDNKPRIGYKYNVMDYAAKAYGYGLYYAT